MRLTVDEQIEKAEHLVAMARQEADPARKVELLRLAKGFLSLAAYQLRQALASQKSLSP